MWNNESIPRKRRAAHQEDKLYTDHCEKVMYLDMCFGLWLLSLCTQGYVNFTENAVFRYNDIQRQMVCQIRRQAWEYFSNNKIFNNAMSMSTLQRENIFLIWISYLEILNDSYWYFPGFSKYYHFCQIDINQYLTLIFSFFEIFWFTSGLFWIFLARWA